MTFPDPGKGITAELIDAGVMTNLNCAKPRAETRLSADERADQPTHTRTPTDRGIQARGGRSHPPGGRLGGATASAGNTMRAEANSSGEVTPDAGSAKLMQQAAHHTQLVSFDDFVLSESS